MTQRDEQHEPGTLPLVHQIQEYDVGLIRMPADNSLLGIAHFRVYVRALNPDTAMMHARLALPEEIREQCFFNVKPWAHQDTDERIKKSLGLETLAERVTAPSPIFTLAANRSPVARVGDLIEHVDLASVRAREHAGGTSETSDMVALLERFRERCAKEAAPAPNEIPGAGPRSHTIAHRIERIDVAEWLLQDSFTANLTKEGLQGEVFTACTHTPASGMCACCTIPEGDTTSPQAIAARALKDGPIHIEPIEPAPGPNKLLELQDEADYWTRSILVGMGVPREHLENGMAMKPAFIIAVDQTGLCVRIAMNGKMIGLVQSITLTAALSDENPAGRMHGKISFFSYPGMPDTIKQARNMLRGLPWLQVEDLELGPAAVQG